MFYIILGLLFIYLLAQWENGATLWESIAPNEPIMATVWIIVIGFIFYLAVAKFGEDRDNKKRAINGGLVSPTATVKEAKEALRKVEVDRQNKIFSRNQRWQFCDNVMDILRRKTDKMYKYQFITKEQKEKAMEVVRKYGAELEKIGDEIRQEKGVKSYNYDYMALKVDMHKTPDYNKYENIYREVGLEFLEGEIRYRGNVIQLIRGGKIIKEVVINAHGLVLGTKEDLEKLGWKF